IGFLGRLDPIKRVPNLLEALGNVPRAHLHIFGEGSERLEIERTAIRLGLTRRVTLHGAVPLPQDALSKIRLLILPSAAEGFGLVLIEAMAARVAVVATDVAGIRDVVKNEVTGLLVPSEQPQSLADAINRLIADPLLRNRLIEAGAADVRERFTWNVVLPKYRELLEI
ncbi:MAG TPA: glycosyltransferase, partial [Tepidisphaeraceae bacterium]|nr:glycosyltransferase [Tepidisphaeraceae bacterium]